MRRVGRMVVKGTEQQKIFLELGAMSLELLPEFNDIYDGSFPDSLYEEVHEDVPYSTMVLGLNSGGDMGCGSPVDRVSDHGRYVMSSSPVPLKTRRVGQRCTLNLSRAETSSRWCGVVVRRGGCQLRCCPRHLTMVQNYVVRRQKPSCS
ncbi:uncharacterized protein TNCV_3472251 [Trichonephila clavipes]|nr:uncharacterized protein TNCV_3472251 [Trichonephila clavipes]